MVLSPLLLNSFGVDLFLPPTAPPPYRGRPSPLVLLLFVPLFQNPSLFCSPPPPARLAPMTANYQHKEGRLMMGVGNDEEELNVVGGGILSPS